VGIIPALLFTLRKEAKSDMDKNNIVKKVAELARPIAEKYGVELVDVEYVRERDWYLRVYIDKEGGIDIDDCSAVSGDLEKELDARDFIKEKYYLEVSSPGIDRPLKKDKDFTDHYGQKVDLAFYAPYEGKKNLPGVVLLSHDDASLTVKDFKNRKLVIDRKLLSSVRPHLDF
jgi:ribosome maturation factor RimP